MTGGWGIVFWVVVAAALVIIEISTVQLVCIWFSVGALFAALACFVDAAFWLQLLVFLISSIAVLIVGRPLLVDRLTPKKQATNADRVIGQLGIVLAEINNVAQTGRVSANGLDWTARSAYGEVIPAGTTVLVLQIDGVKLIVQTLPPDPPMPEQLPRQPEYYTPPPAPSEPEPPVSYGAEPKPYPQPPAPYPPEATPQPEQPSYPPEQPQPYEPGRSQEEAFHHIQPPQG